MIAKDDCKFYPTSKQDLQYIYKKGIKAWLTHASFNQAMGDLPLKWWQKLFRKILVSRETLRG